MRALLDINVLIALLDGGHQNHDDARIWFLRNVGTGWASCPLTQNGCARILSQPSYPNTIPTSVALEKLATACASSHHTFWSDDVSLIDAKTAYTSRIHGPRQLTDLYLLALAVKNGGRFVTFDQGVVLGAVRRATAKHLVVI